MSSNLWKVILKMKELQREEGDIQSILCDPVMNDLTLGEKQSIATHVDQISSQNDPLKNWGPGTWIIEGEKGIY